MTILGVDFETCSAADIDDGSAPYAEHESTRVHCAVFVLRGVDTEVRCRWVPGRDLPAWVVGHVTAGGRLLAHNDAFERAIWHYILTPKFGWPEPALDQWEDSLAVAAAHALPLNLGLLGAAIGAKVLKDDEGNRLMKSLSKVRRKNDQWIYPVVSPAQLERLLDYCETDVLSMLDCWARLPKLIPEEQAMLRLDRKINTRGMLLDLPFAASMRRMAAARARELDAEGWAVTEELVSLGSPEALKEWLRKQGIRLPRAVRKKADGTFHATDSADRTAIAEILGREDTPPIVRDVLGMRLEAGRVTSLAKAARAPLVANKDGRLRNALRYSKAHTGRWASSGLQIHNLARPTKTFKKIAPEFLAAVASENYALASVLHPMLEGLSYSLRALVIAPPGKELIGADFAAIEARCIAWLAGQSDVLAAFADPTRDVYVEAAANADSDNRDLGKEAVLGLGYQMGAVKFYERVCARGIQITKARAREVQRSWRKNNPKIVELWKLLEDAFRAAIAEHEVDFPVGEFLVVRGSKQCVTIRLPSGRKLHYWRPSVKTVVKTVKVINDEGEIEEAEFESQEIRFFTAGKSGMELEPTYGGMLCVAGDAFVLTGRGWIRLDSVRDDDTVHDGVEFVGHGGRVFKSTQACVSVDGVWMTPEHEVLTKAGWLPASSNPKPHRPPLRGLDGGVPRALGREEALLAFSLPLWPPLHQGRHRGHESMEARRSAELRLPHEVFDREEDPDARHDVAPGILGLAVDARSLPIANAPRMAQLRRARNPCLPSVETVPRVLGRHGAEIPSGADPRSNQQRPRILPGQLSVDDATGPSSQQAQPQETERRETRAVYDLMNCGPRRRFLVLGDNGPFVVHNCENVTQALARDLLRDALLRLDAAGYDVVIHVHDSVAAEVPAGAPLEPFCALMSETPPWAPGLPVAVEGYRGRHFKG